MSEKRKSRPVRATTVLFAIAIVLTAVSGARALDGEMLEDADMHVGPGDTFPVVGSAPRDAALRVNGCIPADNWCLVRHGGRHGWVRSASLKLTGITRSTNRLPEPLIVIDPLAHHYGTVYGPTRHGSARYGARHRGNVYRHTGYSRRSYRVRGYRSSVGGGARGPRGNQFRMR